MPNLRDFITIRQAADMIGVSPATLRNWDRSGKLRATRHPINRYRLYRRQDVQALLAVLTDSPPAKGTGRTDGQPRAAEGKG
jgi:excisionase family DNA binding protein